MVYKHTEVSAEGREILGSRLVALTWRQRVGVLTVMRVRCASAVCSRHTVVLLARVVPHHVRAWYAKAAQCCTESKMHDNARVPSIRVRATRQTAMMWQKSLMRKRTV